MYSHLSQTMVIINWQHLCLLAIALLVIKFVILLFQLYLDGDSCGAAMHNLTNTLFFVTF